MGPPWLTRILPASPLCGFVPLLPRVPGDSAVAVERNVGYYPLQEQPESGSWRCALDVWHVPDWKPHPDCLSVASTADGPEQQQHGKRATRPAVLYLHGGAWGIGHQYWHADTALLHRLASDGCVVFSAGYRYSWLAKFPACADDAEAALQFASLHAGRYGATLSHIATGQAQVVVIGASAGGHLAALLATKAAQAAVDAAMGEKAPGTPARPLEGENPGTRARPLGCVLLYPAVDPLDSLRLHLPLPTFLFPRDGVGLPSWLGSESGKSLRPLRSFRGGRSAMEAFFEGFVLRPSDNLSDNLSDSITDNLSDSIPDNLSDNPSDSLPDSLADAIGASGALLRLGSRLAACPLSQLQRMQLQLGSPELLQSGRMSLGSLREELALPDRMLSQELLEESQKKRNPTMFVRGRFGGTPRTSVLPDLALPQPLAAPGSRSLGHSGTPLSLTARQLAELGSGCAPPSTFGGKYVFGRESAFGAKALRGCAPPTLVMHGTHDSILPIEASAAFVRALARLELSYALTGADTGADTGNAIDTGTGAETGALTKLANGPGVRGRSTTASSSDITPGGSGNISAAQHGSTGGVDARSENNAPHVSPPTRPRHSLVSVEGGRHSFSWLLSPDTLAAHEAVVDWVHRMHR